MSTETTPWARESKLFFGRMFEDSAIELAAFAPAGRVFCIASAGCTAFALAAAGHDVCAVDINAAQIAYMRERAAGGSYRRGAAERSMAFGRRAIWPLARLREFLALDDLGAQTRYWQLHLNTRRFRWALRALLRPALLRLAYSAPLAGSLPPRMDLALRGRLERCWRTFPNRSNPYARALFLGEAPEPLSASVEMHVAEACAFLERAPPGSFNAFALSNILDAAPPDFRARLFSAVRKASAPGAAVVWRSFHEHAGPNRAAEDRSMLWGTVQAVPVEVLCCIS